MNPSSTKADSGHLTSAATKTVQSVAVASAILIFAWLLGSFVAWSFNPAEWVPLGRLLTAVCGTIFAVFAVAEVAA